MNALNVNFFWEFIILIIRTRTKGEIGKLEAVWEFALLGEVYVNHLLATSSITLRQLIPDLVVLAISLRLQTLNIIWKISIKVQHFKIY